MSIDILKTTIHELADKLANQETTSVELCNTYLDRIKSVEDKVNAILVVNAESALAEAKASDERRAQGKALSPYDGIPVGIKDNIAITGQDLSCASKILEPVNSPYDATVIERLRAKGFVFLCRTNMDEFAMGSSCENSAFKKTSNPWNLETVPGGSSGGSAAAVAAREVPAALGSDTGGSIRQPAGFCGIVGMKPTYGRVSRYGLVAFASSLDQIGPMTNDVLDAAILLDIIGGHDKMDSTSLPQPTLNLADAIANLEEQDLKGVKIGLPKEYFELPGLTDSVKAANEEALNTLKSLGAEIVDVSLPHTEYAIATYYIIATAEASANLARFDGIRYGARIKDDNDLMNTYLETRGQNFGDEVKRRIILGTYVLSSGYYDAYYLRAQKVRTLIRNDFEAAFEKCDLILAPVTPSPAFKFGEKSDPLEMYLSDIFTISLNLAGNCGISVPVQTDEASKLPIGIQFIGPALGEETLLRISRIFELNRKQQEFIPEV